MSRPSAPFSLLLTAIAGCGPADPPADPTGGHAIGAAIGISVGGVETSASYVAWDDGMACVVWSDLPFTGAWFEGPDIYHGRHAQSGGPKAVEWRCATADGRTGRAKVAWADYDLSDGALFLVATAGPKPRILQLRRDTLGMTPAKATFDELARDPEVAAYFGAGPHPGRPPETPRPDSTDSPKP